MASLQEGFCWALTALRHAASIFLTTLLFLPGIVFPAVAEQLKIVINGNEETITRTPNHGAKTVKTESSKGWEKNESLNNLGLTETSTISGTGVPAAALDPTWRADGSLASVSLTIGGETHSAGLNNDGTLASLNAPGRGNILGGHSLSGGTETLTVDGVTTTRKLDGTEKNTVYHATTSATAPWNLCADRQTSLSVLPLMEATR